MNICKFCDFLDWRSSNDKNSTNSNNVNSSTPGGTREWPSSKKYNQQSTLGNSNYSSNNERNKNTFDNSTQSNKPGTLRGCC